MGGILLTPRRVARRVWGDTPGVLHRFEKKEVAERGICNLLKTKDVQIDDDA
jgi:hypothetical protein